MKLNRASLADRARWEQKQYRLPAFDPEQVARATAVAPVWLHFGAGNLFRALPAAIMQRLLDKGLCGRGIIAAEGFDEEILTAAYLPFDCLSLLVTLKGTGAIEKQVIASVTEALPVSRSAARLREIFAAPSLQLVSFTITEKGYAVADAQGAPLPHAAPDLAAGPEGACSLLGRVAALCYARWQAGGAPLALVSMDNCAQNGEKLRKGVLFFARAWAARGLADGAFPGWLEGGQVTFPWTMIDKITPRPSERAAALLREDGLADSRILRTEKNTFTAAFVNAEEAEYLVVEDAFPNGRPPFEQGGMLLADRETVARAEGMKVGACLNPLHTILAVFGCLLGYGSIAQEMENPGLAGLLRRAGYEELLPVSPDPGIIRPREFLDEVLERRFPNRFLPDSPSRIACDTSQKIPIRFGQALRRYQERGLPLGGLVAVPALFAGWLRYLIGVDDRGRAFSPSPDPLLERLQGQLAGIRLGDAGPFSEQLRPILSDAALFGVDLYAAGLGERVESLFARMLSGPGAVAAFVAEFS